MATTTKKTKAKATNGKPKTPKPIFDNDQAPVFNGRTGKNPAKKGFAVIGWNDSFAVPIALETLKGRMRVNGFYQEYPTMEQAKKAALEMNHARLEAYQNEIEIIQEAILAIEESPEAIQDQIDAYGLP